MMIYRKMTPGGVWRFVKAAMALLMVLIALAHLASCAPKREVCERNYGPCGEPAITRVTRKVDTTIIRPAVMVHDTLRLQDTLALRDTVTATDSSGRAQLTYWRNRAGQLMARCEATPDTVRIRQTMVREVQVPAQPVEQPWWQGWLPWMVSGGVILGVVYLIRRLIG